MAFLMLLGLALGSHGPAWAEGTTLRIGYQKGGGLLAVQKARGTLEQAFAAQGYRIEWREFPAGPQLLEALHAGSVDLGYTGAPPPVFAQAAGIDLVYLGAEPAGVSTEALFVPETSLIRDVAGLRGKRLAVQKGSSAHFLLVAALARAGLGIRDIQPVYLPPADARAAFAQGAVDAWAVWDPYLAAIQQSQPMRILSDYQGLQQPNSFYEASRRFAEAHPQAIQLFLAQMAEAGTWAAAHPGELTALLATQLGLPAAVIDTWQGRTRYGVKPLDAQIIAGQQRVADTFLVQGLIPRPIRVADAVWRAP